MSLASFVSSFFSTIHADAPAEEPTKEEESKEEETPETEDSTEEASAEEEEEEEPEDIHPSIREECQQSAKCAPATKHYLHCQEKVQAGEGYKGEDCVEELYVRDLFDLFCMLLSLALLPLPSLVHMMHCADACAAPKLFSKLR